jgi:hypothetical protein
MKKTLTVREDGPGPVHTLCVLESVRSVTRSRHSGRSQNSDGTMAARIMTGGGLPLIRSAPIPVREPRECQARKKGAGIPAVMAGKSGQERARLMRREKVAKCRARAWGRFHRGRAQRPRGNSHNWGGHIGEVVFGSQKKKKGERCKSDYQ